MCLGSARLGSARRGAVLNGARRSRAEPPSPDSRPPGAPRCSSPAVPDFGPAVVSVPAFARAGFGQPGSVGAPGATLGCCPRVGGEGDPSQHPRGGGSRAGCCSCSLGTDLSPLSSNHTESRRGGWREPSFGGRLQVFLFINLFMF